MGFTAREGRFDFCRGRDCVRLGSLDPGWHVVQREDDTLGFFNSAIGGVIQSHAVCHADFEAVPLHSLTDHLLVGYT